MGLDIKLVFAVLSTIITIAAYYPYIRDIFLKKTKPHAYTWLIWGITQGTATAALIYGGGNLGAMSLLVGTIMVIAIFLLSLKFGTRNITKSDTLVLIIGLLAIIVWWQLKNPLLAVVMVTVIDALGFLPTYRKSFVDPWSETISFWGAMAISNVLALLAIAEYNSLTVTYLIMLTVANTILLTLCISRRKFIVLTEKE